MKLLFCDKCSDVVRLTCRSWRKCVCGRIGGQYNPDGITATVGGPVRVFGIANPFFMPRFQEFSQAAILEIRNQYGYKDSEIWWGDYEGDTQLLHIKSPDGPRLSHKNAMSRVRRMQKKLGVDGKTPGHQFTPRMLGMEKKKIDKLLAMDYPGLI